MLYVLRYLQESFMLSRWLIAGILFAAPLAADNVGNIEFQLPTELKDWRKVNELQGNQDKASSTAIYAPEIKSEDQPMEFFGVHIRDRPSENPSVSAIDPATLEKLLQLQFPGTKVKVDIVEKDQQSLIYEWSVSDNTHEVLHGLTRLFVSPDQTAEIGIISEKVDGFNQVRPMWLKTLKDAHLNLPVKK